jgi:hypothetical protein
MKRLKTLRLRFALWTAGLLVAGLGLFGLFVYVSMASNLVAAVDETLRSTAVGLAAEVEVQGSEPVLTENPIEDPQYAQLREQDFSVRILNVAGEPVQEYGRYRDLPQTQIDFAATNQHGEFVTIPDPASRDPVRVHMFPLVQANRVVGTLQVALNLKNANRTLDLLLITLLLAGPLIVISRRRQTSWRRAPWPRSINNPHGP